MVTLLVTKYAARGDMVTPLITKYVTPVTNLRFIGFHFLCSFVKATQKKMLKKLKNTVFDQNTDFLKNSKNTFLIFNQTNSWTSKWYILLASIRGGQTPLQRAYNIQVITTTPKNNKNHHE